MDWIEYPLRMENVSAHTILMTLTMDAWILEINAYFFMDNIKKKRWIDLKKNKKKNTHKILHWCSCCYVVMIGSFSHLWKIRIHLLDELNGNWQKGNSVQSKRNTKWPKPDKIDYGLWSWSNCIETNVSCTQRNDLFFVWWEKNIIIIFSAHNNNIER